MSRAGAGAGDTDSTYYPASESVDTLVTVTTRHQSHHGPGLSDLGLFVTRRAHLSGRKWKTNDAKSP